MIKLVLLALLAYLFWRFWQLSVAQRRPPPPDAGFTKAPEQLVRCERCGVRVPASELATIRSNCRQCSDGR